VYGRSSEGIQICWDRRYESLTLPRTHLSDIAIMESETTDQLDIVGDHIPHDLSIISEVELLIIDKLTGATVECKSFEFDLFEDFLHFSSILFIVRIESLESGLELMGTSLYLLYSRYLLTHLTLHTFYDVEFFAVVTELLRARIREEK
jgi:hypothetical protein